MNTEFGNLVERIAGAIIGIGIAWLMVVLMKIIGFTELPWLWILLFPFLTIIAALLCALIIGYINQHQRKKQRRKKSYERNR